MKTQIAVIALGVGLSVACLAESDQPGFWRDLADFFLPHMERRQLLYEKQTQYFLVTVEEDADGRRHLVFNPNKGSQGIWDPAAPKAIVSPYCRHSTLFLAALDKPPRKALFIGLGAGVVPRFLRARCPDAKIDIVEIDPEIPRIAEKYFGFKKDPKTRVVIADGRDFINRARDKYDLIFIDAYTAECVPFQLTTAEFFAKVRDALSPNGVMLANIANIGKPEFIAGELKTARSVFPKLAVFVVGDQSNYLFMSGVNRELGAADLRTKAARIDKSAPLDFPLDAFVDTLMPAKEMDEMSDGAPILRDDFAPVETM